MTSLPQLYENGYSRIAAAIHQPEVARLREFCAPKCRAQLEAVGPGGNLQAVTLGVDPDNDPMMLALIKIGAAMLLPLFPGVRYLSGAIIPKYPGEGPRGYHVDWWAWDDPAARKREVPPAVGLIFYLDYASTLSGALCVIPSSHRRPVANHYDILGSFERWPQQESVVSANPGDAILIDSRVMHATLPNQMKDWTRIAVTLWYLLDWEKLSQRVKATARLSMDQRWRPFLGHLYPEYDGNAEPWPHIKIPAFREENGQ